MNTLVIHHTNAHVSHAQSVHEKLIRYIAHVFYISRFPLLLHSGFSVLLCQKQNVFVFKFRVLLLKMSVVHEVSVSDFGVFGAVWGGLGFFLFVCLF